MLLTRSKGIAACCERPLGSDLIGNSVQAASSWAFLSLYFSFANYIAKKPKRAMDLVFLDTAGTATPEGAKAPVR